MQWMKNSDFIEACASPMHAAIRQAGICTSVQALSYEKQRSSCSDLDCTACMLACPTLKILLLRRKLRDPRIAVLSKNTLAVRQTQRWCMRVVAQ